MDVARVETGDGEAEEGRTGAKPQGGEVEHKEDCAQSMSVASKIQPMLVNQRGLMEAQDQDQDQALVLQLHPHHRS